MENKNVELTFENSKLKQELDGLRCYLDTTHKGDSYTPGRFKAKIEELEDLLTQFKIKSQPQKIIELEELILSLKERLNEREAMVSDLTQKLKDAVNKSTYIFDEKQAIGSLSTAMKEKDMIIFNLKNELKTVIGERENKKTDYEGFGGEPSNCIFKLDHYENLLGSNDKFTNSKNFVEKMNNLRKHPY
jgi:hypothetical protein